MTPSPAAPVSAPVPLGPPAAVVFDLGNVLVGWDPEGFYDREIGEDRRRALFAEVDLHGMNDLVDKGALFRETIYQWAEARPAWAPEIRMWYDRWHDIAAPAIEGSIRLRDRLRAKGVPVFSLTNFGRYSFEEALPRLPFLAEFDRQYVSGLLGVIKPDPEIYRIVEEDSGIAPGDLIFTDDRADNIAAAARRGWRTHQFEGWQGWAQRLVAESLLTAEEAGL
ncbi:HAD family hydrolase [Pseudogemmobacter sonorensis]|uniref:HAD family hydrolase n=1 Tax=Pseudogemmobacter sonorensis TaxID=2989681 RepID=UPI0036C82352